MAAVLPLTLSVAISPGWTQPVLLLAFVLVLELLSNNVMEPLLYGQSIGVSEVALLISAAFWTWLWGPIGLVLSTPLTACLVVLGRYVPQLEFFSVLLGDEPVLKPSLSYYQRLLARDEYEAADLVEDYANEHAPDEVFDEVFLPALVLARHGRDRGELTAEDERFILQETREVLDEVVPAAGEGVASPEAERALVLGCPARGEADELALDMFGRMLDPVRCRFEYVSHNKLFSEMLAKVEEVRPAVIVIASLPPGGVAQTRHLCKRLRARFADAKILVGTWGSQTRRERAQRLIREAGADQVASTLAQTRDQLIPLVQLVTHGKGAEGGARARVAEAVAQ